MEWWRDPLRLNEVADSLDVAVEAVRLLVSILSTYPLMLAYRTWVTPHSANIHHLYFILCSGSLLYFNFGFDLLYGFTNIVLIYALLRVCGPSLYTVFISAVFNLAGIVIFCYIAATEGYDIDWTIPQCVLCLRLTGLVWDVYDGSLPESERISDWKTSALETMPSFLEIMGYCCFTPTYMIGPQFPMKRYQKLVRGGFNQSVSQAEPSCGQSSLKTFASGVMLLLFHVSMTPVVPTEFMITKQYESRSFMYRLLYIAVWKEIILSRYLAFWLIGEGGSILSGVSHNGKDKEGRDLWDGLANCKLGVYLTASSLQNIIDSFNINTNAFAFKYVFKRLRFLGNKLLSQSITLLYLAVWHGTHSGYFWCFGNEFLNMKCEKDVRGIINRSPVLTAVINHPTMRLPLFIVGRVYSSLMCGIGLLGFVMFTWGKYSLVIKSTVWPIVLFYLLWPLIFMALRATVLKSPKKSAEVTTDKAPSDRNGKKQE